MSPDENADSFDERIDPVTLEVVRNACETVCGEMNATLVRTSYSPNIKERRDCSCALFDAAGEMIAQAENLPVHLGAMPFSVEAALDRFPPADLEPGDAILLNDPYHGGAHLPDLTLVTPIFADVEDSGDGGDGGDGRDGEDGGDSPNSRDRVADSGTVDRELVGIAANRAHHADVGGARAGSVAADSTDIYQEGLRIPPVKLSEAGEPNRAVFELVLGNVRTPEERRGDLRAQEAANETGVRRFRALVERYGRSDLRATVEEIKDYSERRMRAELAEIPDGTYRFQDVLDSDGRGNENLPVQVAVAVDDDAVTVDFAGTADQTEGPVNAVFAVTASATYYAVRSVTDPDIPPNEGCYRPVDIEAPEGTIVNPEPPAAVVGGNLETSQRVTDVVLGAFAGAVPERVVAGCQGTMNNVTFGGTDPRDGSPYAFYETQGGGFGGRAGKDGLDAVHVHMSNTRNTPVEVLETSYPLRVHRYELRENSGGAGEFRGGLGLRRDIETRSPAVCSLLADRHDNAPYGLVGGQSGEPGAAFLLSGDGSDAGGGEGKEESRGEGEEESRGEGEEESRGEGEEESRGEGEGEQIPPKSTHELVEGAILSIRTPGAGGYGDPDERDPAAIERDLRLGKLSLGRAREQYEYESRNAADSGEDNG